MGNYTSMFAALKNHPFPVVAYFTHSLVLTYAFPKATLEPLIPRCLELDTLEDTYAFVAIALVQTKGLRPKGFPTFLGHDFFLAGYRIFTRYTTRAGKRLRGLYILKSDTDKRAMQYLGSLFTRYRYDTTDISVAQGDESLRISSGASGMDIQVSWQMSSPHLPEGSPFRDWKEARRFAGPLPFTFSYIPEKESVLIVEGLRTNWVPRPVQVHHAALSFFTDRKLEGGVLANAFLLQNVPYEWKKGQLDKWK